MNIRLVVHYLGRLATGLSLLMIIPALIAILHGESDGVAFIVSCGISFILGINMKTWGRNGPGPVTELSMHDSVAITALGWLLVNILGTFPYILSGYLGILDGIFETAAGFTGCGGTVFPDLSGLPHSLLFWRSLTQWLGAWGSSSSSWPCCPRRDTAPCSSTRRKPPGYPRAAAAPACRKWCW